MFNTLLRCKIIFSVRVMLLLCNYLYPYSSLTTGGPSLALAEVEATSARGPISWLPNAKQIWEESILAAVPRNRRSIERRMRRRFGIPDRVWKMLFLKKNLQLCMQCGNFHEPGVMCRKSCLKYCSTLESQNTNSLVPF